MEPLSDSEWMYVIDSVIYSKILTKKEADNLAKRVTLLAGKKVSDLMKYRYRMENQPYFVGDEDIDETVGHIESRVLKQVRLIREAINLKKKVKFNLCVYDYADQNVWLVPYGKHGKVLPETPEKYKEDVHRVVSPFEVIFSKWISKSEITEKNNAPNVKNSCLTFSSTKYDECVNFIKWTETRFVRFLFFAGLLARNSIGTDYGWRFVPAPKAFDHVFTDQELYEEYNFTPEEINIIESVIKERK